MIGRSSPMFHGSATTGADVVAIATTTATTVQRRAATATILTIAATMSVYVVRFTSSKILKIHEVNFQNFIA